MSSKKRASAPTAPTPVTENTSVQTGPATVAASGGDQEIFRKIFFGSLLLMLFITLFSGYNVGFHTDEMDMNNYAKANLNYYLTGGKDTSYLGRPVQDETKIESILRYYGSAFEYIPVVFNRITGLDKGAAEFNSRHVFVQLFGIIGLLFSGLIARRLNGWRTSLITIWLLYLTPAIFGGMLFNSKDIPFCAGYVMTLYLAIKFLDELPAPTWKTTILFMLSFAFTTGTRVAGLMLLASFFMFIGVYLMFTPGLMKSAAAQMKHIVIKLAAMSAGGLFLVIFTWPFVLSDPSSNFPTVLTVVKKFPMKIPLNFEGIFTDSLNIPPHYLLKFMYITIPVVILLVIITGVIIAFIKKDRYNWKLSTFILFASVFPILYAMASNVAIYSAWRHFTFIYPGLCIIGALGVDHILSSVKTPVLQGAVAGSLLLGLSHPITWMLKNHPYEYAYFNEISGGYKKTYYEYETDYWKITMKNSLEWLIQKEQLAQAKDTVTIASDMDMFVKYYVKRHYPGAKIRVVLSDIQNRFAVPWDYAVYSKQFLSPEYLTSYFPPKSQTIYTENIDGMPETVVMKDLNRLDIKAKQAFEVRNYPLADSLLTIYLTKESPDNIGLYGVMTLVKAYVGKNDECMKYGKLTMDINPSDLARYNALCGMAIALSGMHDNNGAVAKLNQAIQLMPESAFAHTLLRNLQTGPR